MIPILRKFRDGRGQTDDQTEEGDFIGRCPTNGERPNSNCFIYL